MHRLRAESALSREIVAYVTTIGYDPHMEPPQSRARVVIASQRTRGTGAGSRASNVTLSLIPRWTSDRAVSAAAQERSRTEARFERSGAEPVQMR